MRSRTLTPEELLGPLNKVEQTNAPKLLYATGDTSLLDEGARVSIVGSRKATPGGVRRASKLASVLVKQGMVVVSGLAEGIDTAAHTSAIRHGGRTIAVIGTPLDQTYPKQNAELQELIARDHLLLSQFAPGYPVQRKNFPLRNRTMALISHATVIIEAGETSGSLSQGWEALRLGRQLYVTKSIAENPDLKWPEKMLEYGAKILSDETLEEFFEFLPLKSPVPFNGELPF
jgi:DNA processing protein